MLLGLFGINSDKRQKVAYAVVATLVVVNLFLTFSRGAWLSFFVVGVLSLFVFEKKRLSIAGLVVFSLCLVLVPALRDRLYLLIQGADAGRLGIWKIAFDLFRESPWLGKGVGVFMDYMHARSDAEIQYAHNCYLQILAETGIVGFATFTWFLVEVLKKGYRTMRQSTSMLYTALLLGFVAFLIHAFFDTQLYSLKLSILFWLLAGFLTLSHQETSS